MSGIVIESSAVPLHEWLNAQRLTIVVRNVDTEWYATFATPVRAHRPGSATGMSGSQLCGVGVTPLTAVVHLLKFVEGCWLSTTGPEFLAPARFSDVEAALTLAERR